MNEIRNFAYTDLSLGDITRPFDGMAAGRFIDMWGRETVFLPEELPEYVRNTKLALASTMDANGQVVGFPIDGMNHDNGIAAGWIIDANLAAGRDVIEFTPRWNERGRGSIGADEMRFFSPTVDVEAKVIIGGSLTNWPATRTSNHQILLRPVELSAQMQTYDAAPIVTLGTILQGAIAELKSLVAGLVHPAEQTPEQANSEGEPMEPELVSELTPEPPAELTSPVTISQAVTDAEPVVTLSVVDLTSEAAQALIMQRAEERAAAILAEREHAAKVARLASRLTGGTADAPRGLPVEPARLSKFLQALSPELFSEAESILSTAAEKGLISFAEIGHSRIVQGQTPLPESIKPILAEWLSRGLSLEKFFETNSVELGSMSDYDLSDYTNKER